MHLCSFRFWVATSRTLRIDRVWRNLSIWLRQKICSSLDLVSLRSISNLCNMNHLSRYILRFHWEDRWAILRCTSSFHLHERISLVLQPHCFLFRLSSSNFCWKCIFPIREHVRLSLFLGSNFHLSKILNQNHEVHRLSNFLCRPCQLALLCNHLFLFHSTTIFYYFSHHMKAVLSSFPLQMQ